MNELAKGQKFMSVRAFAVSDDGNLLAYTTDNTGFRQYVLAVKDLRTGKLLPDHAERVGSVVWANDNKTIFYTVEDATTKRQYQALSPHCWQPAVPTNWFTKRKTNALSVYAGKTRSKAYIFLFSVATPPAKRATFPPTSRRRN